MCSNQDTCINNNLIAPKAFTRELRTDWGWDGITYKNSCLAEKKEVTKWAEVSCY